MKRLFILLLFVFISVFGIKHNQDQTEVVVTEPIATTTVHRVLSVIDGDTITIDMDGETQTVRLLGIDTPEVDPQYNPIECYGREATNATKEKLLDQTITIETDSSQGKRDKFDRILAYVFLADGTNVNLYLIAEGFAKEYTYDKPYKYHTEFRTAEKNAQINEKGLWLKGRCPENT
jgi:micrococcal nuclease